MKSLWAVGLLVLVSGCMGTLGADGTGGGGGGGSGSTGGGTGAQLPPDAGLPCEVATVVSASCVSCHGVTVAGGAPMSLVTRADFLAASARDATKSNGQRSVLRMREAASPMPTSGLLPAAQVDAFDAWVLAGMPEGTCAPIGPPPLTCASNVSVPNTEEIPIPEYMYPGRACISCHQGIGGLDAPPIFPYMGTVFSGPHERDLCAPSLGITAQVEILEADGGFITSIPVNAGGNFMGEAPNAPPASYRARVVTAQGTRTMVGAQTNGDCNTCHTAEGAQGAPGRIFLP